MHCYYIIGEQLNPEPVDLLLCSYRPSEAMNRAKARIHLEHLLAKYEPHRRGSLSQQYLINAPVWVLGVLRRDEFESFSSEAAVLGLHIEAEIEPSR